jgi:iron complex outermembrane receptor protein
MPGIDPALYLGGQPIGYGWSDHFLGSEFNMNPEAIRAGIPDSILALSGIYEFDSGLQVFANITDVSAVYSGFSQAVELPAYTLVNAGLKFDAGQWSFTFNGKNLTDERYFRSNFPNLFGGTIVLPELPRSYQFRASYSF